MEKIFEKELNDQYVDHAIRFPDQFKLEKDNDDSIWCIQRKVKEVN